MKTTLKAELAGNGEEEKSEGGAGMRGILPTPSVSVAAAGKTLDFDRISIRNKAEIKLR